MTVRQHLCTKAVLAEYTGLAVTPGDYLYHGPLLAGYTGLIVTLGQVVNTIFFGNAMATPPIFVSFGMLIPNLTSKISN